MADAHLNRSMHRVVPASAFELSLFTVLCVIYGGLTLALLPWAQLPGPRAPQVIAVSNSGIAIADLFTALLLGREFVRDARTGILLLFCGYVYSAAMALAHLGVFPGAWFETALFGNAQTTAWVFLAWRLGTAGLFLGSVLCARQPPLPLDRASRLGRLRTAAILTLTSCAAVCVLAANLPLAGFVGSRFSNVNVAVTACFLVVCATTLWVIWRARAFDDALYLWLALAVVASATDQVLALLAGGQYTVGWYAAKASAVVSACIVLVFWLGRGATGPRDRARALAAYGAAIGVTLAAVALRWFITPWVGMQLPFLTLYGAVAVAVWIGGWKPAVLAAATGYCMSMLFFGEPLNSAGVVIGTVMFWLSCSLVIGLGDAMRRSEDRFRQSQEGALQGYALFKAVRDEAGRITDLEFTYINRAGALYSRHRPDELIGRTLGEVFPGLRERVIGPVLREVIETGHAADREVDYRVDGKVMWFRHLAVKIGDGVGTSFIDITHSKKLEAELRQRAEDLQRADVNKSRFLALLSHELRNPLAPLANAVKLLGIRHGPPVAADLQAMMERQIEQLRRLIDDLLDVSRIDHGKLELHRSRVGIDAIVRGAIETAKPNLEAKSHELVVRYAPEPLFVDGDALRLTQVVSNLLNNAAKFTPANGRIEIATRAHDGEVTVAVKDNGAGFAAGDERRIFDMFVQLETGHGGAGGLGLGLTLARSVVEMHGGRMEAHSAGPGKGAEFIMRLARVASPPSAAAATMARPARRVARRVMVVDDNVDAADSLGMLLEHEGFDVRVCYDGVRALKAAAEFHPDVAFIDLNMPRMTGFELAAALHAQPSGHSMVLVALTGMGQTSDLEATRAAGFHAHLTKPAMHDEVLRLAAGDGDNIVQFTPASRRT